MQCWGDGCINSRCHSQTLTKSTLITTNKSFAEWGEVFPNAACVVVLVDRLVHHAEIVGIKGQSYRYKEAQEHTRARTAKRKPSKETT
jgi:DNA replication protein DnaC